MKVGAAPRRPKCVLVGDAGVGKTTLLGRLRGPAAGPPPSATVGADYACLRGTDPEGHPVALDVWDTAGQERFRSLTGSYLRGADAAVLVYDVGRRRSFEALRGWAARVPDARVLLVVGNKADTAPRQVDAAEGAALAAELKATRPAGTRVTFLESAATVGYGTATALERLLGDLGTEARERPEERPGPAADGCCWR